MAQIEDYHFDGSLRDNKKRQLSNLLTVLGPKQTGGLFLTLLLVIALPITLLAISKPQEIRQHAAGSDPTQHRIAVRQGPTGPEFYDKVTNQTFIPRGNNYTVIEPVTDWSGSANPYHALFDPGHYNSSKVESALTQMQQNRYNMVRVFISEVGVGSRTGSGLSNDYMNNVVDFLARAANHSIYVFFTFPYLPQYGGYYTQSTTPNLEGYNWFYLSNEGISGKKRYLVDFINGLKSRNARMDYVFAYSLENEQAYYKSQKPLSLSTGSVTTADGKTYDLATQKQQMMDSNLVNWINQINAGIKQVDPTALVTAGFFSTHSLYDWEDRIVRSFWAIQDSDKGGSTADFIDLHIYSGDESLAWYMNDFEWGSLSNHYKPVVMGEMGAYSQYYPTISSAANSQRDWQVESCKYHFSGWLYWTWDTPTDGVLYTALDQGGAINNALSPLARPDPCQPPVQPTPTGGPPPPLPRTTGLQAVCKNSQLSFTWNVIPGYHYGIRINDTSNGWNGYPPPLPGDTVDDEITSPYTRAGSAGSTYTWWLEARSDTGQPVKAAPGPTVTCVGLATPVNLQPSGTIQPGVTAISWNAVLNANRYEVAIKDLGGVTSSVGCSRFSNNICSIDTGTSNANYSFVRAHQYEISVQAVSDTYGVRSSPKTVTVAVSNALATPTNLEPQGIVNAGTYTISWDKVTDATRYEVYIYKTYTSFTPPKECTPIDSNHCVINTGSTSTSATFLGGGWNYRIGVQAVNDNLGLRSAEASVSLLVN